MYAYHSVLLAELHLDPLAYTVTTSRRAAQRFAQLEAVRERADRSHPPTRQPLTRRLLAIARRPQRTTA